MQLSEVFTRLGEPGFDELIRKISIGKLKTYQVYDGFKTRAHLAKLNTETLRKASPRLLSRLSEDEEFAKDLAQAVLVSHLDMISAVLDFLSVPHDGGFFQKDLDFKSYLKEGWETRVFERFRAEYPEPVLLFYINHLAWESDQASTPFVPAA
jgi:hypothetical protein